MAIPRRRINPVRPALTPVPTPSDKILIEGRLREKLNYNKNPFKIRPLATSGKIPKHIIPKLNKSYLIKSYLPRPKPKERFPNAPKTRDRVRQHIKQLRAQGVRGRAKLRQLKRSNAIYREMAQ